MKKQKIQNLEERRRLIQQAHQKSLGIIVLIGSLLSAGYEPLYELFDQSIFRFTTLTLILIFISTLVIVSWIMAFGYIMLSPIERKIIGPKIKKYHFHKYEEKISLAEQRVQRARIFINAMLYSSVFSIILYWHLNHYMS